MSSFAHSSVAFVCSDEHEVLVWDAKIDAPKWRRSLDASLAAVGAAGNLVATLETTGRLCFWRAEDGTSAGGAAMAPSTSLAMSEQACAAIGPRGIDLLDRNGQRSLAMSGLTALRFARSQSTLGVGFDDGRVAFVDVETMRPTHESRVPGGPITALVERAAGEWFVTAGSSLHLVTASQVQRVTGLSGKTLTDVAYGPRSTLLALIADRTVVAVEWPSRDTIGSFTYVDKTPLGISFGADDALYVGLSGGDGNRRDLRDGQLYRTDPHPGRPLVRWLVQVGFDAAISARALARP